MTANALDRVVRHVLPAVNIEPGGFAQPLGFLERARRRKRPVVLALTGVDRQLVYVGPITGASREDAARNAASLALEALTAAARDVCEALVVAWSDEQGEIFAAAFDVAGVGDDPELVGCSWQPPDAWPRPMIDATRAGDVLLEEALARVAHAVAVRREDDGELERATQLVDLELRRRGGEGQNVMPLPSTSHGDVPWAEWLERYSRSVRDEWRRTSDDPLHRVERVEPTVSDGPLAGLRVFLSYARPDATTMAWPVRDGLRASGATVWFDQDVTLDQETLDMGLAETIAGCGAYIMCASNEFFERAGYATQEIAWALRSSGTRAFVVVSAAGTILPTLVADWPRVALDEPDLGHRLSAALRQARGRPPALPAPTPRETLPALGSVADLRAMRARVAHLRRFDEISAADVTALATGQPGLTRVRRQLLDVGAGLDWSGTLADVDSWPADPIIMDVRWRLAGDRAVVGVRGALTDDARETPDVVPDIERMTMEPVPIAAWPTANGWADNERRLALRHHLGRLRLLSGLLRREFILGISCVPQAVIDRWQAALARRRLECLDALVGLRLDDRLSWIGEPPTWDGLFRTWSKLIRNLSPSQAPSGPRALLIGAADEVAAVAAGVCWLASATRAATYQSFNRPIPPPETVVDVFAVPDGAAATPVPRAARGVTVGVSGVIVRLSWTGFGEDGSSSLPAPGRLL